MGNTPVTYYRSTPGRTFNSTYTSDYRITQPAARRYPRYTLRNDPPTPEPGESPGSSPQPPPQPSEGEGETTTPEPPPEAGNKSKPVLSVKNVDYNISSNAEKHHTDEYTIIEGYEFEPTGEKVPPQLVVRRGDTFNLNVTFSRPYDSQVDTVNLVFQIGERPRVSKGTSVSIDVSKGVKPRAWSAGVDSSSDNELTLSVNTPPDAIVGKWNLTIDTITRQEDGDEHLVKEYSCKNPVYLLFNPWCKDDHVYMEDDELRDEYVCNDKGKIYSGNYKQISYKPWNFGQFEDTILDCALYLLDVSSLGWKVRGSPVMVARTISALVNSSDDGGVLAGNWSGDYSGGSAPFKWTGSAAILQQFWETKNTVKWGQCWVFSGVTTTVCRALGLPTRSVTNFSSAHDCDGSCTIDYHYDLDGNPIESMNEDSVWNFHVWNEAWMARPDLEPGYGGWQAFDATPQETSGGIYCAGPCPVYAIKQGNITVPYDTPFIFAEVNADKVYWNQEEDGTWRKSHAHNKVGRFISTKIPRGKSRDTSLFDLHNASDPDREDVTCHYKFAEGSEEERVAVLRAGLNSTRAAYDYDRDDVRFEMENRDGILVGKQFEIKVKMQNKSREKRTLVVRVSLSTCFYTGVKKSNVRAETYEMDLDPIRSEEAQMIVTPEQYLNHLADGYNFRVSVLARVKETNQIFSETDDFRLRRPDLEILAPKTARRREPMEVTVKFQNSMPEELTECGWTIDGTGFGKTQTRDQSNVSPYDNAEVKFTLTPRKRGKLSVVATFDSKQLKDVCGEANVQVD